MPFESVRASRESLADRFAGSVSRSYRGYRCHSILLWHRGFLRFVLINGLTFGVDLLLFSGLHADLPMPIPFAVYLVAALADDPPFILGLSSPLTRLDVDVRVARILGGCCEAVFVCGTMRWVVLPR